MSLKEVRAPFSKIEAVDNKAGEGNREKKSCGCPPTPPVLMHLALFGRLPQSPTPHRRHSSGPGPPHHLLKEVYFQQGLAQPSGGPAPEMPGRAPRPAPRKPALGYWIRRRQQRAPVQSMPAHWQWHVVSARTSHEPQAEPHVQLSGTALREREQGGESLDSRKPEALSLGFQGLAARVAWRGCWGPGHQCPEEMGPRSWGKGQGQECRPGY